MTYAGDSDADGGIARRDEGAEQREKSEIAEVHSGLHYISERLS
jgi:hypothetical protein